MSRNTLISIIILSLVTILSVWVFFSDPGVKTPATNDEKTSAVKKTTDERVKVKDLIITETNEGKKFWEVVATSGTYDKSTDKVFLTNIKGNFYKNDVLVLSVDAPFAIYDSTKKEVVLKNGARAANNKNVLITAKEITWAGTNDMITAVGNVKINQDDKMKTTSDKSVFNTDFTHMKLSGHSNSYVFK